MFFASYECVFACTATVLSDTASASVALEQAIAQEQHLQGLIAGLEGQRAALQAEDTALRADIDAARHSADNKEIGTYNILGILYGSDLL